MVRERNGENTGSHSNPPPRTAGPHPFFVQLHADISQYANLEATLTHAKIQLVWTHGPDFKESPVPEGTAISTRCVAYRAMPRLSNDPTDCLVLVAFDGEFFGVYPVDPRDKDDCWVDTLKRYSRGGPDSNYRRDFPGCFVVESLRNTIYHYTQSVPVVETTAIGGTSSEITMIVTGADGQPVTVVHTTTIPPILVTRTRNPGQAPASVQFSTVTNSLGQPIATITRFPPGMTQSISMMTLRSSRNIQ